jgi:ribose transport system ATP-binding protein
MQGALVNDQKIETEKADEFFLVAKNISKNYGGVKALIESDFSCKKGEVHVLIGENGAGKSTLVKILCGVIKSDTGNVYIKGKEIFVDNPTDAENNGIVAIFQELSLIMELSVAENVFLGHEPKNKIGLIDFKKMETMTAQLFEKLGLEIAPQSIVSDLPLVKQQLVEIAKALSKNPEIIIFDEATSALGSKEVEHLFLLIKRLVKEQQKTVIFISHRMHELEKIADRATIFRDAHYITTFDWGTVTNEQIVNWITGRNLNETFPKKKETVSDEVVLEVKKCNAGKALRNISFELHKGEIVGIAGLAGHGQNEFLKALYGAYPIDEGAIRLFSEKINLKNPITALKYGLALVPEDRKSGGLLLTRSIKENLVLTILDKIKRFKYCGLIDGKLEQDSIRHALDILQIKIAGLDQEVQNLSGGNQQKVAIGKTIMTGAKILLFADPTRGIDIGTKYEIYQLIRKLSDDGISIIFYSTENAELIGLCDRVLVFNEGAIAAELRDKEISETNIINVALSMTKGDAYTNAKQEI